MTIVLDGSNGITAPGGTAAAPSITTTGDTNTGIFFPAADTIAFSEGGVEAARFDSSGNLGLGVTPSAWESSAAIQIANNYSYSKYGVGRNYYYDGANNRYITTNAAGSYQISGGGAHVWSTAPSGTAGNAISFTQAMTLAANGNLLVGTTTDKGYRVLVSGADADDDPVLGSATGAFHVSNSDVTYGMDFGVSSDGKGWIQQQSNTGTATAYDLSLQPVGGNLGIGTSSPLQLVHARKDQAAYTFSRIDNQSSSASAYSGFMLGAFGNSWGMAVGSSAANSNALTWVLDAGGTNAEKMRLDSSGNLGLGVTPSAWDTSASRALQLNGGSVWGYSTSQLNLVQNAYYDGANMKYINTAVASSYRQISGVHSWNIAGSGTAGNTISFTTAMTLSAAGNLGLGTSSPANFGGRTTLEIDNATDGGLLNLLVNGTRHLTAYVATGATLSLIGTASNTNFGFVTNNTERARITSGGVLMVGTTGLPAGNGTAMSLAGSSAAARIYGTTDGTGALYVDKSTNTSTTAQVFVQFTINAQTIGSGQINANGASQAAFGSFSDRRLKDNIVDLASQWGSIKALRPVEFDYIASEGGGHQLGFIAQEVKEVYPDLVGERADKMLTLSGMGKNEARLIKALQEAMARIETLEAKVAALEGNN